MTLHLSQGHWQTMLAEVQGGWPEEACGLLAGQAGAVEAVLPATNALHSATRYRLAPEEQIRLLVQIEAAGQALVGIYHSHPNGPATPSPTDLEEADYPETVYLIWSPAGASWLCRGFYIQRGQAIEVRLEVDE
jgi:proteasome lid subunit RPN8/RPN11